MVSEFRSTEFNLSHKTLDNNYLGKFRTLISCPVNLHPHCCFENMGQFETLKKIVSKIWGAKKQGAKKQGLDFFFAIQKEKRLAFSFLNCKQKNYDPDPEKNRVNATLYFSKFQTLKKYQVNLTN